jgi:hypothetical protein
VKSLCLPLSEPFSVIPAQAGIQGFQSLALGPRLRGDDDFGCTAGFLHSLLRRYDEVVAVFAGMTTVIAGGCPGPPHARGDERGIRFESASKAGKDHLRGLALRLN